MGVKVNTLFMVYTDGKPLTFVAHETYEKAKAAAYGWMAPPSPHKNKEFKLVELAVTRVVKLKARK